MPETIPVQFDWLKEQALQRLFSLLNREGEEVRVVGGAVRNSVIGVPIGDIDCATTATPSHMVALADAAGIRTIPTGIDHGTVTFLIDGKSFEVTSLRRDVETDGRHAVVAFGRNWDVDARRRDFTMNALYVDSNGCLYDPTGLGLQDAQARHIRFIGEAAQRIREDYLRILRFFRFFAQYGTSYSEADFAACISEQEGLKQLSPERVGAEMVKLVQGPYGADALGLMFEGGLLSTVIGGVPHPGRYRRLLELSEALGVKPGLSLLITALVVDGREDVVRLSRVWRLPNKLRDAMFVLCEKSGMVSSCAMDALKDYAYRYGIGTTRDLVLFALVKRHFVCDLGRLALDLKALEVWDVPVFPLTGRDLMARGVKPGPQMGAIIKELEESWIASGFQLSSEQLLSECKEFKAI